MSYATAPRSSAAAISDAVQYRLLFAATFAVFLAAVVAKRFLRAGSAPLSVPRSVVAEASALGHSALALAFQG